MIREIVKDPLFLARKSETAGMEDEQIIADLLDTIEANKERCVGMAANMIGFNKRIIVILHQKKWIVMINPEILKLSGSFAMKEEGCLCYSQTKKTQRWERLQIEYWDIQWKRKIQTFSGFSAQIIQHEMDHLEGILI